MRDDFSIFDVLGKKEQEMKLATQRPLDFWMRQVRTTRDPGKALGMLYQAEEWTMPQKILVLKGMLTLNLLTFLTNNKVEFLEYEGWKKYMMENPFIPAQTLEVSNEKVVELSVQAMKVLRPRVTRDMVTSGRAPKPQKLLGQLVDQWTQDDAERELFFMGWSIYATVMKTQGKAEMSIPIEKKAASAAPGPEKLVINPAESAQVCDLDDIMGRLKKAKS